MSCLRNAWYPAAWGGELGDEPLAHTFLDEPVEEINAHAHLHWEAPANMMLDVGATPTNKETFNDHA